MKTQHLTAEAKPILAALIEKFNHIEWTRESIHAEIKTAAKDHDVKLPKIAMPLRVMVTGEIHTPSIDAVLELLGREETLARMSNRLNRFTD